MTLRRIGFLVAIATLIAAPLLTTFASGQGPSTSREAEAALEAARTAETVKGDLADAIEQYKAIAGKYAKADRAVAARALLQLAGCYEKQVYARIVSEFSDQPAVVSQVRANLQSGGDGRAASGPRMVRRMDWQGNRETSLSPDGRTLATFGLVLMDVASGKATRLAPGFSPAPAGSGWTMAEDAEWPVLSHDSKQVAYEWYVLGGTKLRSELRIMGTEPGAKPRTLVDNPEFEYFVPVGWSPDGRSVLTSIMMPDDSTALGWVSVGNGTVTTVETLGWRLYGRPSLSPSGRYIAYSALASNPSKRPSAAEAKSLERHLYVRAADGSTGAQVTLTGGVTDGAPVWTADETALVFPSNRSGSLGLWMMPVKDGKPAGQATLVSGRTGDVDPLAAPLGVVQDRHGEVHVFYKLDPVGADGLRQKHSLEELPDDGVFYMSERTDLVVHLNGARHLLMFGGDTWPANTCQPAAGSIFGAPGSTKLQVARLPGGDTYVLQAPAGSIARLFDYRNTFAPVDKGLYRFDFVITLSPKPKKGNK